MSDTSGDQTGKGGAEREAVVSRRRGRWNQEIVKEILAEERRVIHQKYRNKIFDETSMRSSRGRSNEAAEAHPAELSLPQ